MLEFYLYQTSLPFHELCLQLAPQGEWSPLYQALVCGANLGNTEFTEALRRTSLLHVAIVSGSHLVLLETILTRSLPQKFSSFSLVTTLLFVFCLMTGWQAPAVRAMTTLFLQRLNQKKKLSWTGPQMTFFSGVLTWIVFPRWFFSYSFILSWGASLSLCLVPNSAQLKLKEQWRVHLFVYILLLPLLLPFGGMHPFSIICNWLVGPVFSVLFFPLSLMAFLIPWISPITDFVWEQAVLIITEIGRFIPPSELQLKVPLTLLWIYIFGLHLIFHFSHILRKRHTP